MKKGFSYLVFFLILITLNYSCKKNWLEAKPIQSLAVPVTLGDFQALLNNNNIMNFIWAPALGEIATDDNYMTNASFNSVGDIEKNAYTWSHNLPYTGVLEWNNTYSIVYYANVVLEGLAKTQPSNSNDQHTWDNIKGQALFFRGMTIYEAAQEWAPPFDSSSASTDIGMPLRLSSDITIASTRSTVQETYDQVITDITQSKDLLPEASSNSGLPSKSSAMAALARIYLSIRDYSHALQYADSCLNQDSILINFNSLNILPGQSIGQSNVEVLFEDVLTNYKALFPTTCLIDSSLFNLYDSNDLRKTIYFTINSDSSISFTGTYSLNSYYTFGGLAIDEIYLIRSECYARLGNVTSAMTDLNNLLQTRWKSGTFQARVAVNAQDALNQILIERRKELIHRGIRWSDLRRLNKDPEFAKTITRSVNGTLYTLSPNSYQYTFPIPDDIIQKSGIQQNKGW
jgi:hypothetical protein